MAKPTTVYGQSWITFHDVHNYDGTLVLHYRFLSPTPVSGIGFKARQLFPCETAQEGDETLYVSGKCYIVHRKPPLDNVEPIWENPWVWQAVWALEGGTALVDVEVLDSGGVKVSDTIDLGSPLNTKGKGDVVKHAPRLVLAINSTPINPGNPYLPPDGATITTLLRQIWERLTAGLSSAWMGPDGARGVPLDYLDLSDRDRAEEEWARQISEMLLCLPYDGPGRTYVNPAANDAEASRNDRLLYDRMAMEGGPYPLVAACQHLSTMGLIARGLTPADFGSGANAGGTEGLSIYHSGGGTWKKSQGMLNVKNAIPGGVGPATLYEFCPGTPNASGSHIGFVLRVHRTEEDQTSWRGIQFFDTGAIGGTNRTKGVTITGHDGQGGNYDNPWHVKTIAGPSAFTGAGVLNPADPARLAEMTNRMRRAWPLGLARLTFYDRKSKLLLYATPLLRMNGAEAEQNFSLARLLWSLRDLPGKANILARWHTYIPPVRLPSRQELDSAKRDNRPPPPPAGMWSYPRQTRVSDLFAALGTKVKRHTDVWVETNGLVRVARAPKHADATDSLPLDHRTDGVGLSLEDIPAYFRGDE